jgi:hypothetical protein
MLRNRTVRCEVSVPLPVHYWSPAAELAYTIVGIQCICTALVPSTLLPVSKCDAAITAGTPGQRPSAKKQKR